MHSSRMRTTCFSGRLYHWGEGAGVVGVSAFGLGGCLPLGLVGTIYHTHPLHHTPFTTLPFHNTLLSQHPALTTTERLHMVRGYQEEKMTS